MSRTYFSLLTTLAWTVGVTAPAAATPVTLDFASTTEDAVSNNQPPFDLTNAEGAPDTGQPNSIANFQDIGAPNAASTLEMATFGGFGLGDSRTTTLADLANFLGIDAATIGSGDFIAFEVSGTRIPFEPSFFDLTGGGATFSGAINDDGTTTAGVSTGFVDVQSFANFFELGPLPASILSQPDFSVGFVLLDADSFPVIALDEDATFKLSAFGDRPENSPDVDAIARIVFQELPTSDVPAPAALPLFLVGLGAVGAMRKKLR